MKILVDRRCLSPALSSPLTLPPQGCESFRSRIDASRRSFLALRRGAILAAFFLCGAFPFLAFAAEPAPEIVEGARYRLAWQGPRADAEAHSRCLEACWEPFTAFFAAAPRLKQGERLPVNFYATHETWAAGLKADGAPVPEGAGGYYHPANRTVYFYRQPTRYNTRCLMIHEACHQFHFLARTGNTGPPAGWYVEGVVEHLALHRWDGEKLELGANTLSLEDYPAQALRALEKGESDAQGLVEGKGNRPVGAMLVRFVLEGEKGRFRRAFMAMAASLDRGQNPLPCFRSHLGEPKALQPRFLAWLREAQCPWTPVFNEWEQTAPDRFLGLGSGVTTACRLKDPARRLEASVELPASGPWAAGLLLHFVSLQEFTVALADSGGKVNVLQHAAAGWTLLHSQPCPAPKNPGLLVFAAERSGGRVALSVGGEPAGSFELPGSALGLALRDGELRFRDVKWELAR